MLTAITGALVSGLAHVLSGPDHLAAVAPLAAADRERGWLAGWTWGIGHASGVVVVAMLAVVLRDLLPPVDVHLRVERADCRRGAHRHRALGAATQPAIEPRLTCTAPCRTSICTSRAGRPGYAAWVMPMRRSTWASCTASRAARISSACCRHWRCRRKPRRCIYIGAFGVGTVAGDDRVRGCRRCCRSRRPRNRCASTVDDECRGARLAVGGWWLLVGAA